MPDVSTRTPGVARPKASRLHLLHHGIVAEVVDAPLRLHRRRPAMLRQKGHSSPPDRRVLEAVEQAPNRVRRAVRVHGIDQAVERVPLHAGQPHSDLPVACAVIQILPNRFRGGGEGVTVTPTQRTRTPTPLMDIGRSSPSHR